MKLNMPAFMGKSRYAPFTPARASAAPPLMREDKTLADKTLAPAPPALCLRWTGVSAILSLTERCTCRYDGCVS